MSIKNKFVVKKEKNKEKSDNKAVKVNHNQLNAKRKMKKKNMKKISKEEKNVEENLTSQVIENSNIPGSSTLKAGTVQGSIVGQKRKLEQSNTEVLNRNKKKKNKFVAEINIEEENVGENVTSKSVETRNIPEPSLKNKKKKKNTQQTNATGNETSAKSSIDGDQETNVQQAPNDDTSSQLPGSEITLELLLNDSAFSALDGRVCEETLKAVQEMGFSKMTEIQAKAIPPLLEGRDVVASAKTGSGKTLAFLIPAIELVHKLQFMPRHGVGCIIISPTRELSMQTFGVLKELMAHHHLTYGLIMGGASRSTEAHKLAKGINIVVATPGRLLDHLQNTPDFLYKNLQCLVIDEADRILQIGFEEDMKQIINLLPKKRQTMLFSATTTSKTEALTRLALKKEPAYVGVQDKAEAATVDGLEQGYVICPSERRFLLLFTFLKKNRKKKVMVFFSSCLSVQFHHELLNFIDLNCMCIHGKQKQMKRTTTFFEFCNASEGILLCTDVAARGLDIPDVDWIVQYDPPDDPKEYIHRVGRTARGANGRGHALLILRPEELGFLFYLKQARIPVNEYEVMDKKVADIQCQLELLISKNYFLNKSAKEAFKSYVRAYDSHHLKLIFDISKLDLVKVAKSFGFTVPPAVDLQVAKSKKSRPQKRTGGGGFGFYKNMNREKSHQNIKYLQPKR